MLRRCTVTTVTVTIIPVTDTTGTITTTTTHATGTTAITTIITIGTTGAIVTGSKGTTAIGTGLALNGSALFHALIRLRRRPDCVPDLLNLAPLQARASCSRSCRQKKAQR